MIKRMELLRRNGITYAFQFVIIHYKLVRYYKLGRNMASWTSGLTHIKKTMKIFISKIFIDSNNLINIQVSHSGLAHLITDFVTYLVVICIYSFYPVHHVAARFFLKIVKMWASPLVHDAIQT